MINVPDSARRNSAVVAIYSDLRTRITRASYQARLLSFFRGLIGQTDRTQSEEDQATIATNADSAGEGIEQRGLKTSSRAYRFAGRFQAFVMQSWLYKWLTAEPEPDLIVIDLRDTVIVGRVLSVLDQAVGLIDREVLTALPTAMVTRIGYRIRNRIEQRPVQIASAVFAVLMNIALFTSVTGGTSVLSIQTFSILSGLILAARGLVSPMSWNELAETTTYQVTSDVIIAAFEPPEHPEELESDRKNDDE